MNLCLLCPDYPPSLHGGTGTVAQTLARALVRRGHGVRVLGMYPHTDTAAGREEDQGVGVWRLRESERRLSWIGARLELFSMVAAWSRAGEIDLVEVPDYLGWAALWPRLPVPVVVRLHGSAAYFARDTGRPVPPALFLLEAAGLRRADFWCSVSRYTAERTQELFRLPAAGGAILHNPVDGPGAAPEGPRTRHEVVFSGTLAPRKGILALLDAWPLVVRACPGAELHVFGKELEDDPGGLTRARLVARLDRTTAATLRFHGHVDRARLLGALQRARLAVFPSYSESFGLAPFEAMSCGCPTIYTRRGCGPELAEDGRDALLVDPDDPAGIARCIVLLLRDDALAARLGEAGRRAVAEKYSIERLLPLNLDFYRSCLDAFRPTAACP